MTQGTDSEALYGRAIVCKECGCDDPALLEETHRTDYAPLRGAFVEFEAIECAECGSVSAL